MKPLSFDTFFKFLSSFLSATTCVFNNNNKLITLNDTKKYEEMLKKTIIEINNIDSSIIDKLLKEYNIDYVNPKNDESIIEMLRILKKEKISARNIFY